MIVLRLRKSVLVLWCSWVADVHKYSFSFLTADISCTDYHKFLLAWQGLSSSTPRGFFCKSTTTGVVEIEMVTIYHMSAQSLRYVYFSIIAYYLNVIKSLLGVTISPILNVCSEFGIYFSRLFFCCSVCTFKIFSRGESSFFPHQLWSCRSPNIHDPLHFLSIRFIPFLCYYIA